MSIVNLFLPPAAIIVGIYFATSLPKVFLKASAQSLMTVGKAGQMADAVRFSGILLIGVGLVATVYNLANMQ